MHESLLKSQHDTTIEVTDSELWNHFKSGDLKSYELIYRNNVQDMFNYGMSIVHDEEQVKDCIQELFLEIWKSRRNLSATNNIRYYLLKALRWKINHYRAREEKIKNLASQFDFYEKHISFPFEDELIRAQDQIANKLKVELALSKLTSRQKEVITLIFHEGLSYEEVANIMSISVGSIYTLAWKAISQLKKVIF
ncbi:sigma-70 family RNA polymerase sigma factor [Reichenbachiella sp. MALMAid0571]|uniref:RNA polymerase sigma factor n=1 Tax=Reichenbachiella sp. MALMAid0571 TaxID=3143939 RepID=UPI0032DF855E